MNFIDLHAHFPMHFDFPPRRSEDELADDIKALELGVTNLLLNYQRGLPPTPRVTLDLAHEGGVSGFLSCLYDPDDEFFRPPEPRPEAALNLFAQLAQVEQEVAKDARAGMARSTAELESLAAEGRLAVIHSVEGAQGLGGDPGNVARLAERGIAYIGIAHLLYRGVATCTNAFPNLPDHVFRLVNPQPAGVGLTELGREIVLACFREHVLVDITHATPQAEREIFEIADQHPGQPVIVSHSGVRGASGYAYNLSDWTIYRIAASGGLIGVILCPHWLRQPAEQLFGSRHLDLVFRAIDHIVKVTGSVDSVGIGSDLDGFIQPVEEVENLAQIPALVTAIEERYGAEAAEKILWGNVLRVLKQGWR